MKAVRGYVEPVVADIARKHGCGFDGRLKSLASVAEKLETGRYQHWSELDDLVAFTVIVASASDETRILSELERRFVRRKALGRMTARKAPDVFRFDATRWYGTIKDEEPRPPIEARAFEIVFEVQVKTVFEHAWSVVTHDLIYKGDDVRWGQRRLAAQLKAVVEQIDVLVEHFEQTASGVPVSRDPRTDAMGTTVDVLRELTVEGLIDRSLAPDSWTRLAENLLALVDRSPTGEYNDSPKTLRSIVSSFADSVRAGSFSPAMSGSLYQAVVAYAGSPPPTGWGLSLEGVPLLATSEMEQIYGIRPPTPFVLDA